jgi:S-sulfo-L-cysteine synthase (O-acetyl-L-serine-dependent)
VFASDTARLSAPLTGGPAAARAERSSDPWLLSVGSTPLVPLAGLAARAGGSFELWAKVEARNPSGSVKDRAAASVVRAAMADGSLGHGRTLVDASSGNTGVAYAMLGARLGFPVLLYVPSNVRPSKLQAIRAYGAEVVLTDAAEGTDGAQEAARSRAESAPERFYFADQYNNPANPGAHYTGTGPEIWRQSGGQLTHFVAGVGTGGTISGAGRYLKERRAAIRVVGVEPARALHGLEGLKHLPTAVRPGTYDGSVLDATVRVETEAAEEMVVRLAREEGLLVGRSSGAAVVAALEVGARAEGSFVVTVLPDGGGPEEGTLR